MALCTPTQALSNFPLRHHQRVVPASPSLFRTPLSRTAAGLRSRLLLASSLPKATTSEETSSGANWYNGEERDAVATLEDAPPAEKKLFGETVVAEVSGEESPGDDQTQSFDLLDKLNIKLDSDDTYTVLLYGGAALVAVWLSSVVVSAIDSIPVFPKLMEVVGLGYTLWFSYRYLIFKKNREELASKIKELKLQVVGSNDD